MPHRCPWYIGYVLINPLRALLQPPGRLVGPYVRPGDTVFEPGPGMGFFTLELAKKVGTAGKVVVSDIEPRMLAALERRAVRAGLADRLDLRQASEHSLGVEDLDGSVDFVLAFAVVHELPDADAFFRQAAAVMKPGARLLFAEPKGHVSPAAFAEEIAAASRAGLSVAGDVAIGSSLSTVLIKPKSLG
jgi:ubiquinone/menaquinone biosynthesis C-methylase UbiE